MKLLLNVFIILLIISCSKNISEEEPNNHIKQAINFDISQVIEGQINNGKDEDYFRFEVEKEDFYSFSISSLKDFDVKLEILNSMGKSIKVADEYFKNFGENIPNLFLTSGTYYVTVALGIEDYKTGRATNKSSNIYKITSSKLSSLIPKLENSTFEKEPNDLISTSQEIKKGEIIQGFYSPIINRAGKNDNLRKLLKEVNKEIGKDFLTKDLDIYNFSIPDKGNYVLKLELSTVQDYDSTIIVIDQRFLEYLNITDEKEKATFIQHQEGMGSFFIVDSNPYDKGEGLANYKIKGNNRYYVVIASINRLNYQPLDKMIKKPYQLVYDIMPITSDLEVEPNDIPAKAKAIENNVIKGYINPISDKDYFYLEGNKEAFYRLDFKEDNVNPQIRSVYKTVDVSVIPPKNIDIALYVYDEYFKLLKRIDNEDKGGVEKIPNLLAPLNTKTYFVVRGGRKNNEDNYKNPYQFKIFFIEKGSENIETEPNDEPMANRTPNTFLDEIKGFVNNKGDVDHYYININRGSHSFTLKNPSPKASYIIELYDSNGIFVKSQRGKKGEEVTIQHFFPKREVFMVKISTLQKRFFDVENAYYLHYNNLENSEGE